MARILPAQTPDTAAQEMLAGVKNMLGSTPNIFTTLAHSSASLGVLVGALGSLSKSSLSGALREQIAVTVAGVNGCDYCASAHTALAGLNKVDSAEISQNLHGISADAKTQAALNFATKIVKDRGHVSDADLKAVRDAGYDDAQIIDIVTVTAVNIFTNYFNHIADTDIDFPLVKASGCTSCATTKAA